MKKITYKHIQRLLLFSVAATLMLMSACKEDSEGDPVITSVRNYAAYPNDTVLQSVSTDQWVVLIGENLSSVTQVYFCGIPATLKTTLCTDATIVIQIPSIPFPSIAVEQRNIITVVTGSGAVATYNINITGAPIISYVRNYADSPNDTILNAIVPGQQINIIGYNLKNATRIVFQGVEADLTIVTYSDTSAVVKVPTNFSGGDASLANMIGYTTNIGVSTFSIKIIGPPIITGISLEMPLESDSVYLYGDNFFSVESLTFAGEPITSFTASDDGTQIGFISPALTQGGPVVITNLAGTFTTAYNVNDVDFINTGGVGILANMEWGDYFGWVWWGGASLNSSDPSSGWPPYNNDFGVSNGMYLSLKTNVLDGGAGDEWGNAARFNSMQWLPVENLNDPVNSWVLKFEIKIPDPWMGGTLAIKTSNGSYMYRYEPWKISATSTEAYSTKGWMTLTIPLGSFRSSEGTGDPISTISDLLGFEGKSELILYMHNFTSAPTETGFYAAFDNFRVVRK